MSGSVSINKVNLPAKFNQITDYWSPGIVGELNGQQVKLVKFKGPFTWHSHANEDEMFLVIKGSFVMELEDRKIEISAGEFIIIPRGTLHRPVAEQEVEVLLFEPATTINTGGVINEFTKDKLERL